LPSLGEAVKAKPNTAFQLEEDDYDDDFDL
jgi:hypothetical protein